MVFRVYVEKKPGFDVAAWQLGAELRNILGIANLERVRLINRYDVEGISEELFSRCVREVFSEPQSDKVSYKLSLAEGEQVFAVEYLPGQFDQRAASAGECIQLISQKKRPLVRTAQIYLLSGQLSDKDIASIKHYVINPVEAREASLQECPTLVRDYPVPPMVETMDGFIDLDEAGLAACIEKNGLAMDMADIAFCQKYFIREGRNPTITEIKVIDTYWSDHCRHTTFGTVLENIAIDDEEVACAFERYQKMRHELNRDSEPICLMDMGTVGARYLKAKGVLKNLDESEEINACSIKCRVDVDGKEEDWLYLFKNETHNHPTEIEPFGGAATCVGGAIRDPLSGRGYVYQAMRVSGAANPLAPVSETLAGKLPQRKLVTTAAAGYSSYGNQIGLATGQVCELYHPAYAAKRMEIGAVVGATPACHVRRETPVAGDVVVLVGGRTGRDGCGGATGSSKAHSVDSLENCGAEVQKGNALTERKIQRLFRRGDACRLIKRCNDFGAGGVSVAVGELAGGLFINLDSLPKKYDGLDGTELAISESQERMAVVLAAGDVEKFLSFAREENLEAVPIAQVSETMRMRMVWRGQTIVDISRDFLASNGAPKYQDVHVLRGGVYRHTWPGHTLRERMEALVSDINICSNKGLAERFDSTIGAATVLMPFGGKYQLTPSMAMVAKLPVDGETTTCSGMAWGFNPYLTQVNQFSGSYIAVVESVCKLVSAGFLREKIYLSFQEYFERLRNDPTRWGKPVSALLGALMAQVDLGVASIGGKDSMSGSFEDLDVVPTLVSFATAIGSLNRVVSPEFKHTNTRIVHLVAHYRKDGITPDASGLLEAIKTVESLIAASGVYAVSTPGYGGVAEALFKMCVGNGIGVKLTSTLNIDDLFCPAYGSFCIELDPNVQLPCKTDVLDVRLLGTTTDAYTFDACGEVIDLRDVQEVWEGALEEVFPYRGQGLSVPGVHFSATAPKTSAGFFARPRVVIPVFPGTNCEYDAARAFTCAGAVVTTRIINNLSPDAIATSIKRLVADIEKSQIIMLPGGFSGADEPDGSAKFIAAFFRSPAVCEAVRDLLQNRDGLILGICNGFQALIKLGLVPYGDICPMDDTCPTLTFNSIGRHQSRLVRTRVASNLSPWLSCCKVDDIHHVAISHGEGRFVTSQALLESMRTSGQIATQYVGEDGIPSMSLDVNPNGSVWAIEGITSPDGRVFGKMGHSERWGQGLYKNIPRRPYELFHQPIFEGGVRYFTD